MNKLFLISYKNDINEKYKNNTSTIFKNIEKFRFVRTLQLGLPPLNKYK